MNAFQTSDRFAKLAAIAFASAKCESLNPTFNNGTLSPEPGLQMFDTAKEEMGSITGAEANFLSNAYVSAVKEICSLTGQRYFDQKD